MRWKFTQKVFHNTIKETVTLLSKIYKNYNTRLTIK